MSKAADMAKISAKGSFHMLWGLAASTIISAIGTIIFSALLGEDNYGLYTVALMAPNLIILFRDWGINQAMIRYIAQSNAENQTQKIKSYILSGLIFELILGTLLTIIGFLLSDFLAITIFNRPNVAPLIQISSMTILAHALVNTGTAIFTGVEKMHLNSAVQVIQAVIKTTLIISLIIIGLQTYGAIVGFTISTTIAGIIAIIFAYNIYKKLPNPQNNALNLKNNIKTMLKYSIPLSIGTIISGFMLQYYNFLMANNVSDNALIGNYGIAQNFVVLITFFASPVVTMMFPAFSKLNAKKDQQTLKNVYQYSVKYASLLVIPVTTMIIVLAQPAIGTIYQQRYAEAPLFLALLSLNYLFTAFGYLSTSNIIASQGDTTFNLKLSILTAAVGVPLGYLLITYFGVLGLILTVLTSAVPNIIVGLMFLKRKYDITIKWSASAKILLSSAIASALTYITIIAISPYSDIIKLVTGSIIFVITYIIAAVITGSIEKTDIINLREMLTSLGPMGKILDVILVIMEKMINRMR